MQFHIESLAEGSEEVPDEFQSSVRCHMTWDTVLREYMQDEKAGLVGGSDVSYVGMNMLCLVKRQTTPRIAVNPKDAGNCSMKSMEIEFQGCSGIGSC
jgi:hypothetical protein